MDSKGTENFNMLKAFVGWDCFYTNLKYQTNKIKWKQAKLVGNFKQTDNNNCAVFICYFFRNIWENKGFLNLKKFDIRKFRLALKKQIENESLASPQSRITKYYK